MTRFVRSSLGLLILLSWSLAANAYQSYQKIGEGSMRWLFFHLYEARLLSPDGEYEENQWPLALELTYQREIKKSDLVQATTSEWQRMAVPYSQAWVDDLVDFWPDVGKGDVLVFHVDKNAVGRFYYNGGFIGSTGDKTFSSAFLSIWLSEQSRNQALKESLVGAEQ